MPRGDVSVGWGGHPFIPSRCSRRPDKAGAGVVRCHFLNKPSQSLMDHRQGGAIQRLMNAAPPRGDWCRGGSRIERRSTRRTDRTLNHGKKVTGNGGLHPLSVASTNGWHFAWHSAAVAVGRYSGIRPTSSGNAEFKAAQPAVRRCISSDASSDKTNGNSR